MGQTVATVAYTGSAASLIMINGTTMHSYAGINQFGKTSKTTAVDRGSKSNVWLIIVDEISFVEP